MPPAVRLCTKHDGFVTKDDGNCIEIDGPCRSLPKKFKRKLAPTFSGRIMDFALRKTDFALKTMNFVLTFVLIS